MYENLKGRLPLGFGPKGGRWNHNNVPLIYCSSTRSLALFEIYCIMGRQAAKGNFTMAELKLENRIPELDQNDLPRDWRSRPHSNATKEFGSYWAKTRQSLCIKVPSARMPLSSFPEEHNLLVNPFYPNFLQSVSVVGTEKIEFE
ncbi:MAG: RES family NAD+ phosphorylase, partial [Pricia sp.]